MDIHKLKQMIKEPASKEWFKKYDSKTKALHKKKEFNFPSYEKQREVMKKNGMSEHNLRIQDEDRKMIKKGVHFPTIGDKIRAEKKHY